MRADKFGGNTAVVRPVPIPNTAVKHCMADGSSCIASARVGSRHSFMKTRFFNRQGRAGKAQFEVKRIATRSAGRKSMMHTHLRIAAFVLFPFASFASFAVQDFLTA